MAIDNLFTQPGTAGQGTMSVTNPLSQYIFDPRTSAQFAPQEAADGTFTLGGGQGYGWMDWSKVPGMEQYANDPASGVSGMGNPNALLSQLTDRGYRLYEQPGQGRFVTRGVVDGNGQWVGGPQTIENPSDRGFWNAAMLAAGGVGAGIATGAIGGAAATGGGAGAASGAGVGAMGAGGSAGGAAAGGAAAGAASAAGSGAAGGGAAGAAGSGAMDWWGLAANLGGTAIQSYQQGRAVDATRAATAEAIAEQRRQYDQTRTDFEPWRQAGQQALTQLQGGMGQTPTAAEIMADPGYQFAMQQGQQALDRRAAAAGGRLSGASLMAASRFNQGNATNFYSAAYQRGQDRLNRLASLAGLGQTATGASAAAGQNAANQNSAMIGNQGMINASGNLAQGSLWGSAANQFGAWYNRRNRGQQPGGYSGQAGWSDNANADPFYVGD